MKLAKVLGIGTIAAAALALAIAAAPSVYGQPRRDSMPPLPPLLSRPGSEIGASVRDLDGSDRDGRGVVLEEVRPGSPAEKAGLRPSDVVTKFDGEDVRGARQFIRLVRETPAGRTVSATVVRDGRATQLSITPAEGPSGEGVRVRPGIEPWLRDQLGDLADRIPFELELPDVAVAPARARLGVSVQGLTPQLAEFFGAKEGVLVSSVSEASPASRAGLRAGDVITSVNAERVQSRGDLLRALRDARPNAEVIIGIVRDKKETSVKATLSDGGRRRAVRRVSL